MIVDEHGMLAANISCFWASPSMAQARSSRLILQQPLVHMSIGMMTSAQALEMASGEDMRWTNHSLLAIKCRNRTLLKMFHLCSLSTAGSDKTSDGKLISRITAKNQFISVLIGETKSTYIREAQISTICTLTSHFLPKKSTNSLFFMCFGFNSYPMT